MAPNAAISSSRILVSGAGIAGLTAALCLAREGFQVEIFEKAERLETTGAGLQLSPNAYRILAQLGLADQLAEVSTFPEAINVHDGKSGRQITAIPLGETVRSLFGYPYCVIHRGDLQAILLKACGSNPAINIQFGFDAGGIFPVGGDVSLKSSSGNTSMGGKAIVLADGVWSRLRTRALDLPAPNYSGKVAWRALIPQAKIDNPELLQTSHLWLAPNSHAVTYPVQRGRFLNVIIISHVRQPETGFASSDWTGLDTAAMTGYGEPLSNVFKSSSDWTYWPIFETPLPLHMSGKQAALIGDAAHAMLPFAAQGAAMAIEDAAVLSNCLKTSPVQTALEQFALLRTQRVNQVRQLARSNGMIYHLGWPFSQFRNIAMRLAPPLALLNRQSWVYGWKPEV